MERLLVAKIVNTLMIVKLGGKWLADKSIALRGEKLS